MSIQNSALLKIKIMGEQALQDLEVLREENIYYKNKINSYVNKLGIYGIQKRMVELDRPVSKSVLEAHPEKQKLSLKSKPSKARTHSYER